MKKFSKIIYSALLLAVVVCSSSCKNEKEPGPAGSNGTNGTNANLFPYYEAGTTLNLAGNFYSDDAAFDKYIQLPFYMMLEESRLSTNTINPPLVRTEATVEEENQNRTFYITRYDSLGNAMLMFRISQAYESPVEVERFHFNVKTNITSTTYKQIYTTYPFGGEGGPAFRVSGPYDDEDALWGDELNDYGNTFYITSWNYDSATHELNFDYNGTLEGGFNSTGNSLTFSGKVKATVRENSFRTAE